MAWRSALKRRRRDESDDADAALLVFGYACAVFHDDDKAAYFNEERHMIAWSADDSAKIDRYDCRLHLHDCRAIERTTSDGDDGGASAAERAEEQLCDDERYRDLHAAVAADRQLALDEQLKRTNGRGAEVAFSYEGDGADAADGGESAESSDDDDAPFVVPPLLALPPDVLAPTSSKQNLIIEKTAGFVATQGPQMEIVIKARQRADDRFNFLDWDHSLHAYYAHVLKMIKQRKYEPATKQKRARKSAAVADYNSDDDSDDDGHYLHPLLSGAAAASKASSAALNSATPTVGYQLGLENDVYSELYNKLSALMPSKKAAPDDDVVKTLPHAASCPQLATVDAETQRRPPPTAYDEWFRWFYGVAPVAGQQPAVVPPPPDLAPVVHKTADFVAKLGPAAEQHLRSRPELRLSFLEPSNAYYGYYQMRVRWIVFERFHQAAQPEQSHQQAPQSVTAVSSSLPPPPSPPPPLRSVGNGASTPPVYGSPTPSSDGVGRAVADVQPRKRRRFHDAPPDAVAALHKATPICFSISKDARAAADAAAASALPTAVVRFPGGEVEEVPLELPSTSAAVSVDDEESPIGLVSRAAGDANSRNASLQLERKLKARAFVQKLVAASADAGPTNEGTEDGVPKRRQRRFDVDVPLAGVRHDEVATSPS